MKYLLDTCVFAEFSNPRPHPGVIDWVDSQSAESLYISVLTIGEMEKGIAKLPASKRRAGLREFLGNLISRFDERLLPLDTTTLKTWGKLVGKLESKGRPLPVVDSLIAATALQHDLALVTRNENDFADTGVRTVNIWQGK